MNAEETEKTRTMKTQPRNVIDISNRRIRRKMMRGGKCSRRKDVAK